MGVMKELDLRRIQGTIGGNRGGPTVSAMSPINNGDSVNLRLSDKASTEMRSQQVTHVQYEWGADADGRIKWLVVTPSDAGLKVRYSNKGLRPHIHIPTEDVGKVSRASGGGSDTCPEERIDGDEFAFRVPDGLRFDVFIDQEAQRGGGSSPDETAADTPSRARTRRAK